MNTETLLDAFERMTLHDLTEFVAAFEDRFNVTAAAPTTAVAAVASVADVEEPAATVTVTLTAAGAAKIQVIKTVRELVPGLGLKEAKELVDAVPSVVLDHVDRDRGERAAARLIAAGADATVA